MEIMSMPKTNCNYVISSVFGKPYQYFQNSSFFVNAESDNFFKLGVFKKLDSDYEAESKRYGDDVCFIKSAKNIIDGLNYYIAKEADISDASLQLTADRSALFSLYLTSSQTCYLEIYFNELCNDNLVCVFTKLDENNLPTISEAKDDLKTDNDVWNFFKDNISEHKGGWFADVSL